MNIESIKRDIYDNIINVDCNKKVSVSKKNWKISSVINGLFRFKLHTTNKINKNVFLQLLNFVRDHMKKAHGDLVRENKDISMNLNNSQVHECSTSSSITREMLSTLPDPRILNNEIASDEFMPLDFESIFTNQNSSVESTLSENKANLTITLHNQHSFTGFGDRGSYQELQYIFYIINDEYYFDILLICQLDEMYTEKYMKEANNNNVRGMSVMGPTLFQVDPTGEVYLKYQENIQSINMLAGKIIDLTLDISGLFIPEGLSIKPFTVMKLVEKVLVKDEVDGGDLVDIIFSYLIPQKAIT